MINLDRAVFVDFGRTGLMISASRPKNCQESFGKVQLHQKPQNPVKNDVRRISNTEKILKK